MLYIIQWLNVVCLEDERTYNNPLPRKKCETHLHNAIVWLNEKSTRYLSFPAQRGLQERNADLNLSFTLDTHILPVLDLRRNTHFHETKKE